MWRLLLGTMGVKSLVQGLNAAATAGLEPRTVSSEVRRRNRLVTAPPLLTLFRCTRSLPLTLMCTTAESGPWPWRPPVSRFISCRMCWIATANSLHHVVAKAAAFSTDSAPQSRFGGRAQPHVDHVVVAFIFSLCSYLAILFKDILLFLFWTALLIL